LLLMLISFWMIVFKQWMMGKKILMYHALILEKWNGTTNNVSTPMSLYYVQDPSWPGFIMSGIRHIRDQSPDFTI
jgi:hypothetical protein